jgi:signal peptidase I
MTSPQIVGLFTLASLVVQTGILWLAVRVCRLPKRGVGRAAVVVIVQFTLNMVLAFGLFDGLDDPGGGGFALVLLTTAVQIVVTVGLIRRLFGGRLGPSIGAFAIYCVGSIAAGLVLVFILRQFVQTYQLQASSMNPNLRGFHDVEALPDGTHLIVAANSPDDPRGIPEGGPSGAIVAETFEYRQVPRPGWPSFAADRFFCNRTRAPERWDAIVFRHPEDTALIYAKRLVGLPGEKVEIRDGAVWVNGERQSPPARLGPIRYTSGFVFGDEPPPPFERQLGPDEFFVLGDNTERSSDSRVWGPVPRENIIGVADAIYWPPDRWRRDP